MIKHDITKDAEAILNRNAVTFETDRRYNNQSAWPFWYSFIPTPYLNTDNLNNGLGLLGIRIPAGEVRDIPIRLDRDSVYRQLNVKYTPYRITLGEEINSTITTVDGSNIVTASDGTQFTTGQPIAWLNDANKITDGVVQFVSGNDLYLEEKVTSVATAVQSFNRTFKWYDTPQNVYTGKSSALTGTIAIAPNQTPTTGIGFSVVGVGTAFDTELVVGDSIVVNDITGATRTFTVQSITNATNMIIANRLLENVSVPAGSTFSISARYLDSSGTITIAGGGNAVVGVSTLFTTEYAVGDQFKTIDDVGNTRIFMVATITDNLNMTITETLSASDSVTASSFQNVGSALTGTYTASSTTKVVTGAGTAFTTEVKEGDLLAIAITGGAIHYAPVEKVLSNTVLYLGELVTNANGGAQVAGIAAVDSTNALLEMLPVRPLTQFIRVTYNMTSLRGRYLYGGAETFLDPDSNNSGLQERPLLIQSLQSSWDGLGQLRTPTLQAYEAICTIRIHNKYSEDVIVNGHLFGYKVTIGKD